MVFEVGQQVLSAHLLSQGTVASQVCDVPMSHTEREMPEVQKTSQRKHVAQSWGPAELPEAARRVTPGLSTARHAFQGDNHTAAAAAFTGMWGVSAVTLFTMCQNLKPSKCPVGRGKINYSPLQGLRLKKTGCL